MSLELGIQLTSWYRVISITLVLILYAPTLTVSQICYDLDGNVLPTYGICTPTDVASVCCGINDACLTHGLCSSINGNYYRGGCTDQTFNSKACSSICVGGTTTSFLVKCDNSTAVDGQYCCHKTDTDDAASDFCCNDKQFVVDVVSSAIAASPTPTFQRISSSTSFAERSSRPSAHSENSLSSTIPFLPLASLTPSTSASMFLANISSAQASSVPFSSPPRTPSSHAGRKIGAGIGALLGAILILGLALLWYRRRGRENRLNTQGYNSSLLNLRLSSEAETPRPPHISAPLQVVQVPIHQGPLGSPLATQTTPKDPGEQALVVESMPVLESSRKPSIPSRSFGRSVPSLVSTNSIIHPSSPGLINAAFAASRILERPSPAPTPDPIYQQAELSSQQQARLSSQQQAKLPTHNEVSTDLHPDANANLAPPLPPKSPSNPHLPLRSFSLKLRPSTSDGLPQLTSRKPSTTFPPSAPTHRFDSILSSICKQTDQLSSPAYSQGFKHVSPNHPPARKLPRPPPRSFFLGDTPNTVKAQLRNHSQPLLSNNPTTFFSKPPNSSAGDLSSANYHVDDSTAAPCPPSNSATASSSTEKFASDLYIHDPVVNAKPAIPNFSRTFPSQRVYPARNASRQAREVFTSGDGGIALAQ